MNKPCHTSTRKLLTPLLLVCSRVEQESQSSGFSRKPHGQHLLQSGGLFVCGHTASSLFPAVSSSQIRQILGSIVGNAFRLVHHLWQLVSCSKTRQIFPSATQKGGLILQTPSIRICFELFTHLGSLWNWEARIHPPFNVTIHPGSQILGQRGLLVCLVVHVFLGLKNCPLYKQGCSLLDLFKVYGSKWKTEPTKWHPFYSTFQDEVEVPLMLDLHV